MSQAHRGHPACKLHWDICPTWSLSQLRGEESGGQACLCWFWMSTLYHLVSLYFPHLGSLGTLFVLPSKPFLRPIPIIYSMVLSFQTQLKCHFLYANFLLSRDTQVSYWPWTQWFFCTFIFKLTSLSPWLPYKSLKVSPIAPFIFVLSGLLITRHILSAL